MSVKENLHRIKSDLPGDVTLVAVSKTKSKAQIMEAYEAGHRDFGENYVQELRDKQAELPADIRWHFIGHLQSNKVKYLAPFVHLIHGIDSLKLLEEVNRQGAKINRTISCLLQLHIAVEETKFGFSFDECEALLRSGKLTGLRHVNVAGFMAMASNTDNESRIREEFAAVKAFRSRCLAYDPVLTTLSTGMSSDYKIALVEGSTMVRIGSLIFGERNYP